jgi:uncharacterized protein YbjQ (UPF0145 family)
MYVTTTLDFAGYRIKEYKGVVRGIVVRAPTISQGIMGGLKQIIGGNIGLLVQHASARGANAIIGMRYDASDLGGNRHSATEVLCYGTAVVIEPVA